MDGEKQEMRRKERKTKEKAIKQFKRYRDEDEEKK